MNALYKMSVRPKLIHVHESPNFNLQVYCYAGA